MKLEDALYVGGLLFLGVTFAYVLVAEGAFSVESGRAAARGIAVLFWVAGALIRLGRWLGTRGVSKATGEQS